MSHFKYSPLDASKYDIRLVYPVENSVTTEDQPSARGAEEPSLCYTLETVSLDAVGSYTALSYCWGSTDDKKEILLNEEAFMVTQNLGTALQHLNREDISEGLWIDAICINQGDDGEKTQQVQRMRFIYERAYTVVIWLGPAADNSDIIMDLLAEIGKQACEFGLPHTSEHASRQWPESDTDERILALKTILKRFIDRVGHLSLIEAFTSFVSRDWWKRVWVTQELVVAKNAIFALGSKRVPYSHVYAAVDFWGSESTRTVLSKYRNERLRDVDKDKVYHALTSNSVYPATAMLSHPRWYRGQTSTKSKTLFSLFLRALVGGTGGFRLLAKDERDYIYAMLGLADDVLSLGVVPDYSLEWPFVYTGVARKLIKAGHVDILALCQKKTLNLSTAMPSWTPDWRAGIEEQIQEPFVARGAPIAQSFSASGKIATNSPLSNGVAPTSEGVFAHDSTVSKIPSKDLSSAITLPGAYVDVIQEKGTAYGLTSKPGEDTLGIMSTLFLEVESFCQKSATLNNQIYSSHERRKEAFWRVPIRDLEGGLGMSGANLPVRATKASSTRYHKFRSITKAYECFKRATAPPQTAANRATSRSGDHPWPTWSPLLAKSLLLAQAVYFLARFFLSRGNWLAKGAWWVRSRALLARGWFVDCDARAKKATRERIGEEWDAVLQEKPDAYVLTMFTTYDRRPFLTCRGYVGLGPGHLLEGDVVCVLREGTVPFILRPQGEGRGGFYVVGEAYVDGIMDGEYMDTNPAIKEFVLY